jgi:hypothetical protein
MKKIVLGLAMVACLAGSAHAEFITGWTCSSKSQECGSPDKVAAKAAFDYVTDPKNKCRQSRVETCKNAKLKAEKAEKEAEAKAAAPVAAPAATPAAAPVAAPAKKAWEQ